MQASPEGQEDGYVLEVLNNQGKSYTVIAVEVSKIESIQNLKQDEFQII